MPRILLKVTLVCIRMRVPVDFLQTQEVEGDTSIVTLQLFIVVVYDDDDDDVDIVDPL